MFKEIIPENYDFLINSKITVKFEDCYHRKKIYANNSNQSEIEEDDINSHNLTVRNIFCWPNRVKLEVRLLNALFYFWNSYLVLR